MFISASILILLLVSEAGGVDVNIERKNTTGACLCGLLIELDAQYTVTEHFDGHGDECHFDAFYWDPEDGTTLLLWCDPKNGDCQEQGKEEWWADGEWLHIGWTTDPDTEDSNIKTQTGVDDCGTDDDCSDYVLSALPDMTMINVQGEYVDDHLQLTIRNDIPPEAPVYVGNISFELVDIQYPLVALNGIVLTDLIPVGVEGEIHFNEELIVVIPLIKNTQHPHVVVALDVRRPGAPEVDAKCYFQFHPSQSAIPTLTEWGLIIFGVVLLGFITWVFLKRRRVVGVRV